MVAQSTRKLLDNISKQIASMNAGVPAQSVVGAPDPAITGKPYDMGSGLATGNGQDPNPGIISRALDVISRPLYGVANTVMETSKSLEKWSSDAGIKESKLDEHGKPFESGRNPFDAFWRGISGQDKTMFHDVIKESETETSKVPDAVAGIGGFALDVALDPLMYTTFGIGPALSKGAKAGAKALSGEKGYTGAVKEGRTLTEYLGNERNQSTIVAPATKPGDAVPSVPTGSGPGIVPPSPSPVGGATVPTGGVAPVVNAAPIPPIETIPTGEPALFDLTPAQKAAQSQEQQHRAVSAAIGESPPAAVIDSVPKTGKEPLFRDQNAQTHTVWKMTSDLSKVHSGQKEVLADGTTVGRNQLMERDILQGLDKIKNDNIAKGVYPVVRTPYGSYHLDVSDIFNELGPKFRAYHLAPQRLGGVPPSSLIAGTGAALDAAHMGLGGREALDYVSQAVKDANKTKTPTSIPRSNRVAGDLIARTEGFQRRVIDNEIAFGMRDATQGTKIGNEVADETARILDQPMLPFAESIHAVSNVTGKINAAAKAEGISTSGAMLGAKVATERLSQSVPVNDIAAARTIAGVAKDVEKAAPPAKTRARLAAQEVRNAKEISPRTYTLGNRIDSEVQHGFQRAYAGLLSRSIHGYRQGDLAANYRNWGGFGEALTHRYTTLLNDLHKTYRDVPATLTSGMTALRISAEVADPGVAKAVQDLLPMVEHLLPIGTGRNSVMETAIVRNGIDLETFNMLLKEHGVVHQFDIVKGKSVPDILQQWKTWDIKEPLSFLGKVQAAVQEGVARAAVSRSFTKEFGVDSMRQGYGRIMKTEANMSRYIDPDKFYPLEAIDMLRRFNNLFDKPTSYRGQTGLVANFANNVIDPYLAVWKPSVTIARPGHHVRTAIGDFLMNALDGVLSSRWYMKAANIQRAGGQFTGDLEKLTSLAGSRGLPDATGTVFTVKLKGGGSVNVSYGQAYRHATQDGLLPSYKITEDVLQQRGDLKIADKIAKRIGETKYIQAMGAVSETSSHHFRLAQYASKMSNPKFTKQFDTVEEASNAATKIAQRSHPDVRGLAPGEAKTMRRLIPFYTWFRQAMPVVFNTMLTHPGRVSEVPKAFIAAQVAMGIDPGGMDEPFSPDKIYPSFIQQHLTGNLSAPGIPLLGLNDFSANIGSPIEGAADIFNGNVSKNLIGLLNPLLKAPIELPSQQQIGDGRFIPDRGEYIDQMLPFVNQVSNLSGYSAAGSVANIVSGEGPAIDPQRAMQKGEKDAFLNRSTLNFLLGLGIQDLDRPSYQKIVAKEAQG